MKIIKLWCLIAQIKQQNTLIAMQKASTLSDVRCQKNQEKPRKIVIFGRMVTFGSFFFLLFFQQRYIAQSQGVALQSVRPGASFKLSNTPKK